MTVAMKFSSRVVILTMFLAVNNGAIAQWQNAWSIQLDGGLLYDVYTPSRDQNILDVPIKDMRSFYSDFDRFNPNASLQITYAVSPLWGWTGGYSVGSMTGSNETDRYRANLRSIDAGVKFFSSNLNPSMANSKWSLTPEFLLSYSDFKSELSFIADNSLQNIVDSRAFGHTFGLELTRHMSKNVSLYGVIQHRTVYHDGLDGWDYGSGSDSYFRMNLGIKYRFAKNSSDTRASNRSDINVWSQSALVSVRQESGANQVLKSELPSPHQLKETVVEGDLAGVSSEESKEQSSKMEELQVAAREATQRFEEINQRNKERAIRALHTVVFFESESSFLKPEMRQSLFLFKESLNRFSDIGAYEIVVTSFTDKNGSDDYNSKLRELRANAVKSYLLNELEIDAKIHVVSKDHEYSKDDLLDRRVEISIELSER